MKRAPRFRSFTTAIAVAVALTAAACSDTPSRPFTLHPLLPFGQDPLAGAATLRITAGSDVRSVPIPADHATIAIELSDLSAAAPVAIVVDALAADGASIVARGASPPVKPSSGDLWVFVAAPGSVGSPPGIDGRSAGTIDPPRSRHAAVFVPGFGTYLLGGRGADGTPLDTVSLWMSYDIIEAQSSLYALGHARSDLAAALGADGYLACIGGVTAAGPTSSVELVDPTGSIGYPFARELVSDGQPTLARSQGAVAALAEGILVFGGLGSDERPRAGAIRITTQNGAEPIVWPGAVPRVGMTATTLASGEVVLFGGGAPGGAVLERYGSATGHVVSPDPTMNRTGHTATLLSDGRVLWVGGVDDAGRTLGSATLFDPVTGTATELSAFLAHPRSGHTATLAGHEILFAGGAEGDALVAAAEAFDAGTLAKLREVTLAAPRIHHAAVNGDTESVVLLGGEDLAYRPIGLVEIYQPVP
jgi:hypothetical protein